MQKERQNARQNDHHDSEILTYEKILIELREIENRLILKNLYSLLGCARGLLKSQNKNLTSN